MNKLGGIFLIVFLALVFVQNIHSQLLIEEVDTLYEDNSFIRENPDFEFDYLSKNSDITVPYYIDRQKNRILLNGADWNGVRGKFRSALPHLVSIVHIGDSHIQAEISTIVTRERLQIAYGSAGRGLIAPLRLSGTNQPVDYKFESSSVWVPQKILKTPWTYPMGFNGISLTLKGSYGNFSIVTDDTDDFADPFMRFSVFHTGSLRINGITDEDGFPVNFSFRTNDEKTDVYLWKAVTGVNVDFSTDNQLTMHGVMLSGERPGLFYHAIGNNGATFSSYNRVPSFGPGVKSLNPDIIILSLGTNEAFGKLDTSAFRGSVETMIRRLKSECPQSNILVVTPMECQRRMRRGKKRASVYSVNTNVASYRKVLLDICKQHHIASYDWYEIAGGEGSSKKWLDEKLLGSDRVHYTSAGYKLNGLLLYEALHNLIEEDI